MAGMDASHDVTRNVEIGIHGRYSPWRERDRWRRLLQYFSNFVVDQQWVAES